MRGGVGVADDVVVGVLEARGEVGLGRVEWGFLAAGAVVSMLEEVGGFWRGIGEVRGFLDVGGWR